MILPPPRPSHEKKKHIDLFSGIGGFALAARRCGIETQVFCEQDEFCQKILRKNFGPVPIIPNIFDFNGRRFTGAWLLSGGFPCQPFSWAGECGGESDDRFLWPEMLRVIDEAQPRWVIAENVAGLVTLGLDRCISDLASINYAGWPIIVPACAVDAKHRRDRVWIVAYAEGKQSGSRLRQVGKKFDWNKFGDGSAALSNHVCQQQKRIRQTGGQGPEGNGAKALSMRGGRNGSMWLTEPNVGRVASRIPDGMDRLHALGNSIVPQVAEVIIRTIIEAETLWLNE